MSAFSRRLALAVILAFALLSAQAAAVWAHPLGNFSVNRYSRLHLEDGRVTLFYVVDMAEIPAFQEWARIDANADGAISDREVADYLQAQAAALGRGLQLMVNGRRMAWAPLAQDLAFEPGQGGLQTLRLTLEFVAHLPGAQWQVDYTDNNFAGRLGWQEIVVRAGAEVALLQSTAAAEDLSNALRDYPQDLLQRPPLVRSASLRFAPASAAEAPAASPPVAQNVAVAALGGAAGERFANLIALPELNSQAVLLAVILALLLGAAHALTPGHGKTVVAAYLVGARGAARHALVLGLTTTLTHTAGVFGLGLLTLAASRTILPERLYPWLGVISGVLVVAIGLNLLHSRLAGLMGRAPGHHHHPGHQHHDHDHDHGHGHHHLPQDPDAAITWRGLLALGISGGLLPCPSALILLLGAIALGRVGLGLALILAFSLGLAAVLTAVGILFVYAGRFFTYLPLRQAPVLRALPAASAGFVTLAGLGITLQALAQVGGL